MPKIEFVYYLSGCVFFLTASLFMVTVAILPFLMLVWINANLP